MAEYYTPEEIQEIFDAYNQAIAAGVPISKDFAQQLKDATLGVKNYHKTLESNLKALQKSIIDVGGSLKDGKQGAKMYTDSMDKASDALVTFGSALGPYGKAVAYATAGLLKFGAAALKQSDAIFESYQKISRAGAVGEGAMTDVYSSLKKFGYTVDQFGELNALLTANSKNFGLFSASAIKGSQQFADIADELQNSPFRRQMFNLGLTADDINKGLAGFYKQEGTLGKTRNQTTQDLIAGSRLYIKEMEILTRLTGQTREEMEAQREEAFAIESFYASISELPDYAQKEALAMFNRLYAINKDYAKEFASNFSGVITGSTDLLQASQGRLTQYNAEFFKQGGKATDGLQGLSDSVRDMLPSIRQIGKVGVAFGGGTRAATMLANKGLDPLADATNDVTKSVERSMAGFDAVTDSQAGMRDAQIKTSQNINDLINLGVRPATAAFMVLTQVVETLTSFLPGRKSAAMGANEAAAAAARAGGAGWFGAQWEGMKAGARSTFGITGGGTVGGLKSKIAGAESGGDYNAKNPLSSATGKYQFTQGTFQGLAGAAKPGSALFGKTWEDYKGSPDLQEAAMDALIAQNQQYLLNAGVRATDSATYMAHWLGPGGAIKVLQSPEGTPLSGLLSPNVFSSNPNLKPTMTVADIKGIVDAKIGGGYAFGGVASGPKSGYTATLHGTEAVVPLPNGRSIPVEQVGSGSNDAMTAQIDRLDAIVNLMSKQLAVSNKMLAYQH